MHIQYLSDNRGNTTAVQLQIPIEDWDRLKAKYKELAEADDTGIPAWQMKLGSEELSRIEAGESDLKSWQEVKAGFRFE